MSTFIVENLAFGGTTAPVDSLVKGSTKMWAQYVMAGTATVNGSYNVSSLTDLGVGSPQLNLAIALSTSNGAMWNTPGFYTGTTAYAVQAGGRVSSTTTVLGYCGSDSTTRADWSLGSMGAIG